MAWKAAKAFIMGLEAKAGLPVGIVRCCPISEGVDEIPLAVIPEFPNIPFNIGFCPATMPGAPNPPSPPKPLDIMAPFTLAAPVITLPVFPIIPC